MTRVFIIDHNLALKKGIREGLQNLFFFGKKKIVFY